MEFRKQIAKAKTINTSEYPVHEHLTDLVNTTLYPETNTEKWVLLEDENDEKEIVTW